MRILRKMNETTKFTSEVASNGVRKLAINPVARLRKHLKLLLLRPLNLPRMFMKDLSQITAWKHKGF